MTDAEARKLIAVMTAALPREWSFLSAEQQQATRDVYSRMLADLPYPAANAAVESLLATATRMPTIADVRAATLTTIAGHVRPGGDAWGDVRALATYRDDGNTAGIDPTALKVCERYGWIAKRTLTRGGKDIQQWCVTTGENEAADRARFIELYDQLARVARHEQNVSQLPAAQRYRALQASNNAALPAAPDGNTLGETNARSEQNGPARVDFNRFIPERTT